MLLTLTFYAALIGLFAVVYRHILAYEPVLNWWFVWGARFEDKWFYKPIWGCELCISGQLALWSYALNWFAYRYFDLFPGLSEFILYLVPLYRPYNFNVLEGLIFITQAIASAFLWYKGFKAIKED